MLLVGKPSVHEPKKMKLITGMSEINLNNNNNNNNNMNSIGIFLNPIYQR